MLAFFQETSKTEVKMCEIRVGGRRHVGEKFVHSIAHITQIHYSG